MTFDDTTVLATACINMPKLGERPARTPLIGAALLTVRHRFRSWSFDLQADSTTITDNAADTMSWLADRLNGPARLILWRAEDIVVPSLIAAAETARDVVAAGKLLRKLDRAFSGEVIDVAVLHGGAKATSFDAVAHQHGLPFVPLSPKELAEMHRLGNHGRVLDHLATRATTMWRLWLDAQPEREELAAATQTWLGERDQAKQNGEDRA